MDETFLEAAERAATHALEEARARLRSDPRPKDFDGTCQECGDVIPEARVALGYFRCVGCQSITERRHRYTR